MSILIFLADKLDGFVKRKRLDSEADNQELSLKEYLSSKTGISGSFRKRVSFEIKIHNKCGVHVGKLNH